MRTIAACVLLAAAVTVPGIVVAATASEGHSAAVFNVTEGAVGVASSNDAPVDPQLQSATVAISRALRARGATELRTVDFGRETEIMQSGGPDRPCPVHVQIAVVRQTSVGMWFGSPGCSATAIRHGDLKVVYSPRSLGSAIREALATLPG